MGEVADTMRRKLVEALTPTHLEIIDDSHRHVGHAGHDGRGESHFRVHIVSPAFEGRTRLERQRLINSALVEELADRVHALSAKAEAPSEIVEE